MSKRILLGYFSSTSSTPMSIIKTYLCSKMEDDWMNHLMIYYTEKEIFRSISNDKIIKWFEEMKNRRMLVPRVRSICSSQYFILFAIQIAPREDPH